MMPQYTVGFAFYENSVVLTRQKGLLDGIGSEVKPSESIFQTMRRSFKEETGLDVPYTTWNYFGRVLCKKSKVHLFRAYLRKPPVEGSVELTPLLTVHSRTDIKTHLKYMIPFALCSKSVRKIDFYEDGV